MRGDSPVSAGLRPWRQVPLPTREDRLTHKITVIVSCAFRKAQATIWSWQTLTNIAKAGILYRMEDRSSITTLNVSLPEAMRKWIQAQVADGGYSSASEYVRSLIRADQKRISEERLDALLLEGLQGKSSEMTAKDWQDIRSQLQERLKKRRRG